MPYEYYGKVKRVVDGDTVDLDLQLGFDLTLNIRVRMYGINAPEIHSKNAEEKKSGLVTMKRLEDLVLNKDVVVRTFKDKQEKFGRILAEIFNVDLTWNVSEPSVNKILISENLAKEYYGGKR